MKKTIKLILVILCMIFIFSFSSDNAQKSTKKSDNVIIKISETIFKRKLTEKEKEYYTSKYIVIVRKSAHFTIYLILGFLISSLLKEYMIINKKNIIMTIIIIAIYACSDEIHQLFIPGRSGEIRDVLIDTLGGFTGSIFYRIYFKIRRKNIN